MRRKRNKPKENSQPYFLPGGRGPAVTTSDLVEEYRGNFRRKGIIIGALLVTLFLTLGVTLIVIFSGILK